MFTNSCLRMYGKVNEMKDYFYDSYRMADFYDDMYNYTADLELWYDFIDEKIKVLEIACGSGRMTTRILKKYPDISLTAMDYSQEMLDLLEEKVKDKNYPNLKIKCADMRQFDFGETYDVIVIASNSLNHIETYEDLEDTFNCFRKHLRRGGYIIFDLLNPKAIFFERDENTRYGKTLFLQRKTGRNFLYEESNKYDPATQINKVRYYFRYCDIHFHETDDKEYIMDMNVRLYYPQEFDYFLKKNDFVILGKYDWYDRRRFTGERGEQIYVVQPKDNR